jgi:hypothetical protein
MESKKLEHSQKYKKMILKSYYGKRVLVAWVCLIYGTGVQSLILKVLIIQVLVI